MTLAPGGGRRAVLKLQASRSEPERAGDDLAILLDCSANPLLIVDGQQRLRRFSRAAGLELGLKESDLGRALSALELGFDTTAIEEAVHEARAGQPAARELVHRDGRRYRMRVRCHRARGRVEGSALDFERLEAAPRTEVEAALDFAHTLVDTLHQPLMILDCDLRLVRGSSHFFQLFDLNPEEVVGRRFDELGGARWEDPTLGAHLEGVLQGVPMQDFGLEHATATGVRRVVLLTAQTVPGSAPPCILVSATDTGQPREASWTRTVLARTQRSLDMEAEAGRVKDEFLANVSHELRGPLSSIGTWAHVLSSPQTDPATQRQAVAAIERSVKAGARLIDDLLDLSRVLAGKLNLSLRLVDLAPIVEAAVETAQPAAAAKEIDLQVAREPGPFFVLGDADRLQQIAWNLLSNAVKFTPRRGQVRVAIARDGSLWKLQVSDTGQGLDPEFVPHVFERFRQAENGPSRRHSGLGLGLAIVRQLAELHGGQVAADSEGPGKGAVFTVRLPVPALLVTPSAEAVPETTMLKACDSDIGPDALKGRRVLLVDDDPDAREALVAVLGYYGAEVRSASNVLEALEAFVLRRPDVLVSDLAMPEQDGFDLIRLIRALPATDGGRVPAVALSAFASHKDRDRALAAGFNAHVPKPAEPAQLIGTLLALSGPLSP